MSLVHLHRKAGGIKIYQMLLCNGELDLYLYLFGILLLWFFFFVYPEAIQIKLSRCRLFKSQEWKLGGF